MSRRLLPRALAFTAFTALVALTALATPRAARADTGALERVEAQALFDDARKLMTEKKFVEACPKLEESQRIDPGLGTLLNLAECQAETGKTATAWANFREAAGQAKAAGQTNRENAARARAAKLEAKLSRVKILADAPESMVVTRDGVVMTPSLLGTAVPVDPGEHVIRATAPGKKPWETKITVRDDGQPITVSVPRLEAVEPPPRPPPPVIVPPPPPPPVRVEPPPPRPLPPPPERSSGRIIGGAVLGVVGLGGVGAGAAFAFMAEQKYSDSLKDCARPPKQNQCTAAGVSLRGGARDDGDVATVAILVGAAVAAGGLGLGLSTLSSSAPPRGAALTRLTATINPTGGLRLGLEGSF